MATKKCRSSAGDTPAPSMPAPSPIPLRLSPPPITRRRAGLFLGGAIFHHSCLAKEAAGLCQPPTPCPCSFLPFSCVHPFKGRHPPGGGYSKYEKAPLREQGGLFLRADGTGLCYCSYPLWASSLLPPMPWLHATKGTAEAVPSCFGISYAIVSFFSLFCLAEMPIAASIKHIQCLHHLFVVKWENAVIGIVACLQIRIANRPCRTNKPSF